MITHVAVKTDDVVWFLPPPNRHHNVLQMISESGCARNYNTERQGFLIDGETFMGRKEAYIHAMLVGQVTNRREGPEYYQGDQLFSEDLW
jgi:hypothetical protein